MGLFHSDNPKEKQHKGLLGLFANDVIKWEPEDAEEAGLIAIKYPYEDFPNGSHLIVGPSQMAIFTNNLIAGNSLESTGEGTTQLSTFIGECKIKLETGDSRFAPFRNISHALTGGESAFHSTVYFINKGYMPELSWGTQSPIVVEDPLEEVNVHVRAFGMFGVHIEQTDPGAASVAAKKFLTRVVGTRGEFSQEDLMNFTRAKILEYVPDLLGKAMVDEGVGILKISTKLSQFSTIIHEKLKPHFEEYGLILDNFSFHSINAPDEDLRAINEMKIKRKQMLLESAAKADTMGIEAVARAKAMDVESEARARMREREGYSFQQERAFDVMQTAATNEGNIGGLMGIGMGFGLGGAMGANMTQLAGNTVGNVSMEPPKNTESGSSICKDCGHENPKGAKFCLECGSKINAGEICPDCGKELVLGAKFCPFCGKKMQRTCPNCGVEIADGAKFCVECGTKI